MSDDGLDAELLALAGGAETSSEEEDNIPTASPRKARPSATRPKSGATSRQSRRAESDDEGSLSGSRSRSPSVRARSRSVGSATSADNDTPLYPLEGKFRSDADKKEILSMTEIEREEILAERAAETQRRTQDRQLKKLLSAQRRGGDIDTKKRKVAAADLDDSGRKSSRQKTKATENLEEYKRQREIKGAQRARGEEERKRGVRSPSAEEDYNEQDTKHDSEVEWDDGRRRASPASKDEPPPELRDFERTRAGRTNFAKVCFYPTFENLIRGCYCRVNVGMDGGPRYRMVQIKDFREGRPYLLDGPNNKKIHTNQYVLVAHGKKENQYPLSACSDSKFTEAEFDDFKAQLQTNNMRLPTRHQLIAKVNDITSLIEHQFTDFDIQAKLDKADAMRKAFSTFSRERLARRRDDAAGRGDDATVARCNTELAALDAGAGHAHAFNGTSHSNGVAQVKRDDQQNKLAALNKANRKINSDEIRKALVAEKVATQRARAAAAKLRADEEQQKKAVGALALAAASDDLFGEAGDRSRTATPSGEKGPTVPAANALKEKKSFGQFAKKKMDDEVIGSMDLGIDIDI